jgi:ABC-type oligopeptide transport system ATPase subunit
MQTQTIIQHSTNSVELTAQIAEELFTNHLRPYLQKLHSPTPEPRYHSKKETAKILGIAMSNLSEKTKNGEITASRLGSRVLYSDDDIKNALQKIRTV